MKVMYLLLGVARGFHRVRRVELLVVKLKSRPLFQHCTVSGGFDDGRIKNFLVNFLAYYCKQLASGLGVLPSKVVIKITFQLIARFERNSMTIAIQTFAFSIG